MARFNSIEKRGKQRPKPKEALAFGDELNAYLKSCGLSEAAIGDLEDKVWPEYSWLVHSRDLPKSKEQRRKLQSFRNRLAKSTTTIAELDPYTRIGLIAKVQEVVGLVDDLLKNHGHPGNTRNDLDMLVCQIAVTLARDGLTVTPENRTFQDIIARIFQHLGEDQGSMDVAIERAWNEVSDRRSCPLSSQIELIEAQRKAGYKWADFIQDDSEVQPTDLDESGN